jgi:hypothetical protein
MAAPITSQWLAVEVAPPAFPKEIAVSTATARWLSKPEAADYLGISEKSLRKLTAPDKNGVRALNIYNPVPGRAVLDRDELDAYILENCAADPERPKVVRNPTGINSGRKRKPRAKKTAA